MSLCAVLFCFLSLLLFISLFLLNDGRAVLLNWRHKVGPVESVTLHYLIANESGNELGITLIYPQF